MNPQQSITAVSESAALGVLTEDDRVLCKDCWRDGACPCDTDHTYYVSRWLAVGVCEHCGWRFDEAA